MWSPSSKLPPHPATIVQPKLSKQSFGLSAVVQRAPHPATVVQPRPLHPAQLAFRPSGTAQRSVDVEATKPRMFDVAPGIVVLIMPESPSGEAFVKFITTTLGTIAETPIGAELLHEFDRKNKANTFPVVEGGKLDGATAGAFVNTSVVICPVNYPPKRKKGSKPPTPLTTGAFEGVNAKTGKFFFNDRAHYIPKIGIWDASIAEYDEPGKKLTEKGVEKHADLEKGVWPWDAVLFHELCHAYLFLVGISEVLDSGGQQEENFVTGLAAGLGWRFSENAYRAQKGYELRSSYEEVKLWSKEALEYDWEDLSKSPADILKALGVEKKPVYRTTRFDK